MSDQRHQLLDLSLNKKEWALISTVFLLIMGYILTVWVSKIFAGIVLLPIVAAPILAIFFVKCLRCQLQTKNLVLLQQVEPQGQTVVSRAMKYIGYVIYTILFAVLGLVSILWLLTQY